jgi:hypothetical protein
MPGGTDTGSEGEESVLETEDGEKCTTTCLLKPSLSASTVLTLYARLLHVADPQGLSRLSPGVQEAISAALLNAVNVWLAVVSGVTAGGTGVSPSSLLRLFGPWVFPLCGVR